MELEENLFDDIVQTQDRLDVVENRLDEVIDIVDRVTRAVYCDAYADTGNNSRA